MTDKRGALHRQPASPRSQLWLLFLLASPSSTSGQTPPDQITCDGTPEARTKLASEADCELRAYVLNANYGGVTWGGLANVPQGGTGMCYYNYGKVLLMDPSTGACEDSTQFDRSRGEGCYCEPLELPKPPMQPLQCIVNPKTGSRRCSQLKCTPSWVSPPSAYTSASLCTESQRRPPHPRDQSERGLSCTEPCCGLSSSSQACAETRVCLASTRHCMSLPENFNISDDDNPFVRRAKERVFRMDAEPADAADARKR